MEIQRSLHAEYLSIVNKKDHRFLTFIKKVSTVALAILLSPILLSVAAIIGTGHVIGKLCRKIQPDSALLQEIRHTRNQENIKVFKALQKISRNCPVEIEEIRCPRNKTVIELHKLQRHVLRIAGRTDIKRIKESLLGEKTSEGLKQIAQEKLKLTEEQWKEIQRVVSREMRAEKHTERAEKQFQIAINRLKKSLEVTPQDYMTANKKVISLLRKALQSDYYLLKKEDHQDPAIVFLHTLSAGMWTKVKLMKLYKKMGEHICAEIHSSDVDNQFLHIFKESQKVIAKKIPQVGTLSGHLKYTFKHPRRVLNGVASLGGVFKLFAKLFGQGTYDSHKNFSNHSSLQSISAIKSSDTAETTIFNVYGGSPTRNDEINPEFEALLQAAETNLIYPEERISGIPDFVYYSNLQNIDSTHSEAVRSKALMRLNIKYPFSFFGITLAKDSSFYRVLEKGQGKDAMHWEGAENYGKSMLAQLNDPSSFMIEGRPKNGKGFYFPESPEEWSGVFEQIIQNANAYFAEHSEEITGKKALQLKGAYQEYVYLMIENVIEAGIAKGLTEKGVHNPLVLSQKACKENIDRGGVENAKNLYVHLDEDRLNELDTQTTFAGMVHSRVFSVSRRGILGKRVAYLNAFLKYVRPEKFMNSSSALLEKMNLQPVSSFAIA